MMTPAQIEEIQEQLEKKPAVRTAMALFVGLSLVGVLFVSITVVISALPSGIAMQTVALGLTGTLFSWAALYLIDCAHESRVRMRLLMEWEAEKSDEPSAERA